MKVYFLIKLLGLKYTWTRLNFQQLSEVENSITVPTDNGYISINTEGPLNFIRGYLYDMEDFINNKKALSPEINHSYTLKAVPKDKKGKNYTYTYTRNPEKDTVYESQNEKDRYITEFYNSFVGMFPSISKDSLTDGSLRYSFANFILENPVEEDKYYILAALLLLSEGVDVRLEWKEENNILKKLVLKRAREENLFFSIDVENRVAPREGKESQHDAKTVIDFFIRYKNRKDIVQEISFEEFKKADFLDSSQFLIQAFIFYLLESV